jgi:hypothetical protein
VRRAALAVAAAAIAVLDGGCYTHEPYLVDSAQLARARALGDGDRGRAVIEAHRAKDGRAVHLLAATLQVDEARPETPTTTRVPSHTLNRMVTAAQVLTWVGSAISVAGTIVFVAHHADLHDATASTAGIVALSAEPVMLTGTMLWIYGQTRNRPEEVPTGRRDLLYLDRPVEGRLPPAFTVAVPFAF